MEGVGYKTMKYSLEHEKYLNNIRKKKIWIIISQWGVLIVLLLSWELMALTGVIDAFIFSSPSRIISTLFTLWTDSNLLLHVGVTLYETVAGFLIATAVGTLVAICLWWCENLRRIFEPYLVILNSLPKVALGPIIIIWAGAGTKAIITMAVLICIIITTINMLNGFVEVDKDKILLMKTLGANKLQVLTKLILPANVGTLLATLKINVGLSWVGSIMGEYLVSKAGLGYLIVYGGQIFKLDLVMASTVVLCLLAGLMYYLVALLEKKLNKK